MFYQMNNNTNQDDIRGKHYKVVFYGRVSTEHEAQICALKNQMQWYEEVSKSYPNWQIVDRYIDEGITGTQVNKRPEFLRMYNDAKEHKFDLIVTREVSRFARNTVDCLSVIRELKNNNIGVFFVQEGIWTMENEGEMYITMKAMFAQEESQRLSERIKAGLEICKRNGVVFGSGNVLGYDKVNKNYVINKEQAETVKMIFNLYESGCGIQQIRNTLIECKRKNASGIIKWDNTNIYRCLHNTIYKGVIGYNKSHINNPIEQKLVKNKDEDTYLYVKGNFEPIISEEQWERCKQIRESRKKERVENVNGEIVVRKNGSIINSSVWTKKLRCSCGSSMRKNNWFRKANGERTSGYKCYNQLNRGSGKITDTNSVGYCNTRAVCGWKIDLMAKEVFKKLFEDKKNVYKAVNYLYKENALTKQEKEKIRNEYKVNISQLEIKLARLLELYLNGEIDRQNYVTTKTKIESDLEQNKYLIKQYDDVNKNNNNMVVSKEAIEKYLLEQVNSKTENITDDIIDKLVYLVKMESEEKFRWYISFEQICDIEKMTNNRTFTINYKKALSYRKNRNDMLRQSQWKDLTVEVYY